MDTYALIFTALADGTRRSVLEMLGTSEVAVGEVAQSLPVSRPAVSQHLKILKNAGLVEERKQGTRRLYRVKREGLLALRRYTEQFWSDVLESYQQAARDKENKDD